MTAKDLVGDGNGVNRTLLKDVLQLKGYEILEAKDGSEGLRLGRRPCRVRPYGGIFKEEERINVFPLIYSG